MNQYAILELLSRAHPKVAREGSLIRHDPETYAWYQSALAHGFETTLSEVTRHVYDVELTPQDEADILDTLEMYEHMQFSFEGLQDKGGLTEDTVKFPGWDGHRNELSFARLFCFRADSYREQDHTKRIPDRFAMVKPSPAYDSHSWTMPMYRRMLGIYAPIRKEILEQGPFRPLTLEEIKSILKAEVHPDNQK